MWECVTCLQSIWDWEASWEEMILLRVSGAQSPHETQRRRGMTVLQGGSFKRLHTCCSDLLRVETVGEKEQVCRRPLALLKPTGQRRCRRRQATHNSHA